MERFSIQSIIRKGRRAMLVIISILLSGIILLAVMLLILSPGKPQPFSDQNGKQLPGSIAEKIHLNINGVKQGMFIKSKSIKHPVLLYLHGGMPDYFLTKKYPTRLEDYFTVVWWEQRGSGISYSSDILPESLSLAQMLSDTKEVTDYLRKRFGQDKIYLMGHSGGTYIGMHAAAQTPGLYHAYIGVAQMSSQLKSEKLAYDYMLAQYKEKGNSKMVRKLESVAFALAEGTPDSYLKLRDQAMHQLGIGTTRDMNSVITGIFFPSLSCKDYTFPEKINMWRGKSQSGVSSLWDTMLATDMATQVPELEIPVYFFHGTYDYTVSYPLAKDYFYKLRAPVKGFYTFSESAHSPLFEEPEKMKQIFITDIFAGTNMLADKE